MLQHELGPAFLFCGFQPRNALFMLRKDKKQGENEPQDMENDLVLVLPGLVIGIECKSTLDNKQFRKACKQWDRLKQVLENELGLGSGYKFVKCLAYQNTDKGYEDSETCVHCKPYLLKFESQEKFLEKFRQVVVRKGEPPEDNEATSKATVFLREMNEWKETTRSVSLSIIAFRGVIRDLLIFTSKEPDASDIVTRVSDAFAHRHRQFVNTPANSVFFWDPTQYEIIQHNNQQLKISGGTLPAHII